MSLFFILTLLIFEIHAGLVEPCAKWDKLPVKICRGTKGIYASFNDALEADHRSTKRLKRAFKNEKLSELEIVTSNNLSPEKDQLWEMSKYEIKKEFTKERTGIYFEFVETDNLEDCDSVLFFSTSLNGYEGLSSIGKRSGASNRNVVTNKKMKTPSFTFLNVGKNIDKSKDEDFSFSFKNTLIHEIGHLAGLKHAHEYKKEYDEFFETNESVKKSKTSVDVCGLDPYSIMSYHYLNWVEETVEALKSVPSTSFCPPENRTPSELSKSRLSDNDMMSLRCLYDQGQNCPKIECKKK